MELATPEAYERDPEFVWSWYEHRFGAAAAAEPNPGHVAIAELELLLPRVAVVTHASPKQVDAILASGEALKLTGDALRGVQAGLKPHAPDDVAIERGAIIRVIRTTGGPEAFNPELRLSTEDLLADESERFDAKL